MRFGTFITTFDRPQTLVGTIENILAQTRPPDVLAVVDNGTDPQTPQLVGEYEGVRYVSTGTNLGSAGGTAFGMELLHADGCDWIHSVDDDNPPLTGDTLERMMAAAERHTGPNLGAVGAVGTWWDWRRGQLTRIPDGCLHGDLSVDTLGGNSQLTVHRRVIDAIGPPEREFFFGFYDPLFSLRMKQAGFEMWIDGDLMREYRVHANRLGADVRRSVVPRDPDYAVWRRYYVSRNYIHRMRRTFSRPDLARREALRGLTRSAFSFARGPRYGINYTRLQVRGIADGYRDRLGRRIDPVKKPSAS